MLNLLQALTRQQGKLNRLLPTPPVEETTTKKQITRPDFQGSGDILLFLAVFRDQFSTASQEAMVALLAI